MFLARFEAPCHGPRGCKSSTPFPPPIHPTKHISGSSPACSAERGAAEGGGVSERAEDDSCLRAGEGTGFGGSGSRPASSYT